MNCREVDRWLDEGSPGPGAATASAHAANCARCSGALRAAHAIEALLVSEESMTAPPGFTSAVMARLAKPGPETVTPVVPLGWGTSMPWWLRAAAEPPVVLAAVLAACLPWLGERVGAAGANLALGMARDVSALGSFFATLAPPVAPPLSFGLLLGTCAILALAAMPLCGWTTRLLATPRPSLLR